MNIFTVDNFNNSNWKKTIESIEEKTYNAYYSSFIQALKDENNEVYRFIACICSIHLSMDDKKTKYSPIIEDITEEQLDFLENILPQIDDYVLKSRIADILWIKKKPRNIEHAKTAMEALIQFPLEKNNYNYMDNSKCWHRAIELSISTGKTGTDYNKNIYDKAYKYFIEETLEDMKTRYHIYISDILLATKLYTDNKYEIVSKLEKIVNEISVQNGKGDYKIIEEYYNKMIDFLSQKDDIEKTYNIYSEIAKAYLKDDDTGLGSSIRIHNAITYYQKIPKNIRNEYITDEDLQDIYNKKKLANEDALSNMWHFEYSVPLSVEQIDNDLKDKSFEDSILYFAKYIGFANINDLKKHAEERAKKPSVFDSISTPMIFDGDRLKSYNIPSPPFKNDEDAEKYKEYKMREYYTLPMDFFAQHLLHVKNIIDSKYKIDFDFCHTICLHSGIIPYDRVLIFAKGIYFGFENDYLSAVSILVPQIENLIREMFIVRGYNTRNFNRGGNDKELSLDELFSQKEKCIEILGEDLYFTIQTLLGSGAACLNFRNNLAHGLCDYNQLNSYCSVFIWYIIFKIIFSNYYYNLTSSDSSNVP